MSPANTPERMVEALLRARSHWQRQLSDEVRNMAALPTPPPVFTIAISREAGTDGEEIARLLGERLGWTVYDHELVEHIAQNTGVRAELIDTLDERPTVWLREVGQGILQAKTATANEYLMHLVKTLTSLAAHGDCIIVGRGAAVLLPKETTLAVRLVAPLKDRIAAIQARQGLSQKEAKREIETTDNDRREFVTSHFQKDPADPQHYDLVLNVARLTQEQCVELIAAALQLLQASAPRPSQGA